MKSFFDKWNRYKYRFVPWIALNLKNRTARIVAAENKDKIIPDDEVRDCLLRLLPQFCKNFSSGDSQEIATKNLEAMTKIMGFAVERGPSSLSSRKVVGTGVFVRRGSVPKGSLVALYPGTIYRPYEPILLQSLGNPFIFRCLDGFLIDGKDTGISKAIYKSCVLRDRLGGLLTSDLSWLTKNCANPLNVGQYVNNQSKGAGCNVAYQEVDVPEDGSTFSLPLLGLLPNAFYSSNFADINFYNQRRKRRLIALISVVDIPENSEILSSYFTFVH
ncbi:SET domain-containing protein 9-like [Ischnura elegans]|uniref:SET domain-containing protein 9-like n=1 Tax=Ischnura elegans TaxID=197161 RepID=UPI001ED88CAD|nr:SET domain-containing protein 9-like [Ischnura elegans]